jgi:sterol desaturase/sphingolipid hydroxylase (fatty acid hydroxylase superfamily)
MTLFSSPSGNVVLILGSMAGIALVEAAIPLQSRARGRAHLWPNLALTFVTFATNAAMSALLVLGLIWLQERELGFLNAVTLPPPAALVVVLVALDLSFYVAHVAMHKWPGFWRFHAVHHSDPFVDVTTTVRQHPGEGLIRYAFTGAFACALGASPGAFAVYRLAVALNGLLEHANLRAPRWLDRALALVTTWPHMHKLHHSRDAAQTDSNYGNLFSFWDRLFGTYTPSHLGTNVAHGLEGTDDAATQSTRGLLALPFRSSATSLRGASTAYTSSIRPEASSSMRTSERGA